VFDQILVDKVKMALLAMQRRAWEQGVAAQALLELGEADLAVLLAKDAVVNQLKDGRLGVNEGSSPVCDPAANGEPLLFAARRTGDPALQAAAQRMLDFALYRAPRTRDGIIFHNMVENRLWIDGLYMLPPFLAAAGQPEEAVRQVRGYRQYLFNPEKRLFYHIWDDDLRAFERKLFWGVGNGWAAAGMARVIDALPAHMQAEKDEIAVLTRMLLEGALACVRADGLFHDILDDPATFVETNTAQMMAYTIYRGAASGWLDGGFLPHADRMRAGVHARVDSFGLVQGVCGAPNFNRPGTAAEGQAFFLLMEAARRAL
jgi:rhamnogalacturonyl hydrolase YesR